MCRVKKEDEPIRDDGPGDGPVAEEWFVYIVECADGTFYTGITTDLERRVNEHDGGTGARYTRGRRPVVLRYHESLPDRSRASAREYRIKALSRAGKQRLIDRAVSTG